MISSSLSYLGIMLKLRSLNKQKSKESFILLFKSDELFILIFALSDFINLSISKFSFLKFFSFFVFLFPISFLIFLNK